MEVCTHTMDEKTKLAIEYIVFLVPDEMKATVQDMLLKGSLNDLLNGIQGNFAKAKWEPSGDYMVDRAMIVNGVLLGFAIGILIQTNPQLTLDIKNFFEYKQRTEGKNVFNFYEYRAKRASNPQATDHSGGPGPIS